LARDGRPFEYFNVAKDTGHLDRMLKLCNGGRRIPVIVEDGNVTIGFNGRA